MSAMPPALPIRRMTDIAAEAAVMVRAVLGSGYTVAIVAEHESGDPRLMMRCPAPSRARATRPEDEIGCSEGGGLDGLMEGIRRVVPARWPGAEYAYIGVHVRGASDVMLPIPFTPPDR
jgi:hypothetical protein